MYCVYSRDNKLQFIWWHQGKQVPVDSTGSPGCCRTRYQAKGRRCISNDKTKSLPFSVKKIQACPSNEREK